MDLNSFIIGILLAFIGLQGTKDDNIKRLEKPVSYENKKETLTMPKFTSHFFCYCY